MSVRRCSNNFKMLTVVVCFLCCFLTERNSAHAFVSPLALSSLSQFTSGNSNSNTAAGYSSGFRTRQWLAAEGGEEAGAEYDAEYLRQLQILEEQQRKRIHQQVQQQLLDQDPLLAQEAGNGRIDLPDWKVATNKDRLAVFSESDRGELYQPSPSKSSSPKSRRSADLPGLSTATSREVPASQELHGTYAKEEKQLVRPQGVETVTSESIVSSSTGAAAAPYMEPPHESTSTTMDLLARLSNRQTEAVDEHPSIDGPAREVDQTVELNIYPRNKYGEPHVESHNLVMTHTDAATTAASVLGEPVSEVSSVEDWTTTPQNPDGPPGQQQKPLVMAQQGTPKEKAQQFLATTPNAGMAEILDMDRAKAYSLSSSARMAASILNKSEDEDATTPDATSKKNAQTQTQSKSHFAMSPSNANPEYYAKSKPVMARSKTAVTASKVLMTGVEEEEQDVDSSGPVDTKTFFFRPDQAENPVPTKPSYVDNPFEYKQTLSQPEQSPALARRAHLYAQSLNAFGSQKATGVFEGTPTQGQKIFAQGFKDTVQEQRGLSPGLVGNGSATQGDM
ncbi:MAG: hypothetical protein SGILL_004499, partial [Bacillariaceae sp.]